MRASLNLLASATLLGLASAVPADENLVARAGILKARQATLDSSCDRTNPFKSSEKYSVKVRAALGDVATLSNNVISGRVEKKPGGDVTYRMSDAFTHYFTDDQYDQVMKMMQVIYNDRLPADDRHSTSYKYTIRCGSDQDKQSCGGGSYAATGFSADNPVIILCDKFFDTKEDAVKNELSARDGSSGRRGWCQKDAAGNAAEKFPFFSVSALTLFHEMTHLDLVGKAAGLSERTIDGVKSHGTVDIYDDGTDSDKNHYKRGGNLMQPYDAARQLKYLYDRYNENHSRYKPVALTTENAESYAASALEWHFELLCLFSIESAWSSPDQ